MKNDFIKVTKKLRGTQMILPAESILCVWVSSIDIDPGAIKVGDTVIVVENYGEDEEETSKIAVEESIDLIFRMLHLGEWKNNE